MQNMIDSLSESIQRDWNLINSDANYYSGSQNNNHSRRTISRKTFDNNLTNNSQQQFTNDPNELNLIDSVRNHRRLGNRASLDRDYDTDGALAISSRHHRNINNDYDYLISPRLSKRHFPTHSSTQGINFQSRRRLPHKTSTNQNQEYRDINQDYEDDTNRRQIRVSHRSHNRSISNGNQGAHAPHSLQSTQNAALFPTTISTKPLRIIFMRHSERVNQALGPDWFNKAFRTNKYQAYDSNLPFVLPKRRFEQAYEYDVPLTVRGLKVARLTGRSMINNNLLVDICLSSSALRCIQTCERILSGMERRDHIPIRVEPGLFECPHLNYKLVDSFMTKTELIDNRYNIKYEYKPIISKITVPETLDEYFERSAIVMRGILDRYGQFGGTILIVTHAPGLLALTDALKGLKPNGETFYRTVSAFPPLSIQLVEYNGSKWKYSEQPFTIPINEQ